MGISAHDLDKVKAAASKALAASLLEYSLTPADVQAIGGSVLDAIDTAAGPAVVEPFEPGRRVTLLADRTVRGTILRSVSQYGEVHTVVVRWDGQTAEEIYGPRELLELAL